MFAIQSRLRRRARRAQAGFSLIELMVVIAIMGLLATVVAVNVMGRTYDAKVKKVQADFDAIKKAIELYKLDNGKYPQRLDDLWQAPGGLKNWKGPYLNDAPPAPQDPWGTAYKYDPPTGSGGFTITSYGADGAPGPGSGIEDQDLDSKNITKVNTGGGN